MNSDDILKDIELPDAMTPEERLRAIARLLLKAIRIRMARQAKLRQQTEERKESA